jgi:hypothetical protein
MLKVQRTAFLRILIIQTEQQGELLEKTAQIIQK